MKKTLVMVLSVLFLTATYGFAKADDSTAAPAPAKTTAKHKAKKKHHAKKKAAAATTAPADSTAPAAK
jgi:Na+-transporting methylmalonyl-CoA/oxaloacetate decarboxylase gamma subunit